jgi:hypothetical protein
MANLKRLIVKRFGGIFFIFIKIILFILIRNFILKFIGTSNFFLFMVSTLIIYLLLRSYFFQKTSSSQTIESFNLKNNILENDNESGKEFS